MPDTLVGGPGTGAASKCTQPMSTGLLGAPDGPAKGGAAGRAGAEGGAGEPPKASDAPPPQGNQPPDGAPPAPGNAAGGHSVRSSRPQSPRGEQGRSSASGAGRQRRPLVCRLERARLAVGALGLVVGLVGLVLLGYGPGLCAPSPVVFERWKKLSRGEGKERWEWAGCDWTAHLSVGGWELSVGAAGLCARHWESGWALGLALLTLALAVLDILLGLNWQQICCPPALETQLRLLLSTAGAGASLGAGVMGVLAGGAWAEERLLWELSRAGPAESAQAPCVALPMRVAGRALGGVFLLLTAACWLTGAALAAWASWLQSQASVYRESQVSRLPPEAGQAKGQTMDPVSHNPLSMNPERLVSETQDPTRRPNPYATLTTALGPTTRRNQQTHRTQAPSTFVAPTQAPNPTHLNPIERLRTFRPR